jgi:hypothetical protein
MGELTWGSEEGGRGDGGGYLGNCKRKKSKLEETRCSGGNAEVEVEVPKRIRPNGTRGGGGQMRNASRRKRRKRRPAVGQHIGT